MDYCPSQPTVETPKRGRGRPRRDQPNIAEEVPAPKKSRSSSAEENSSVKETPTNTDPLADIFLNPTKNKSEESTLPERNIDAQGGVNNFQDNEVLITEENPEENPEGNPEGNPEVNPEENPEVNPEGNPEENLNIDQDEEPQVPQNPVVDPIPNSIPHQAKSILKNFKDRIGNFLR